MRELAEWCWEKGKITRTQSKQQTPETKGRPTAKQPNQIPPFRDRSDGRPSSRMAKAVRRLASRRPLSRNRAGSNWTSSPTMPVQASGRSGRSADDENDEEKFKPSVTVLPSCRYILSLLNLCPPPSLHCPEWPRSKCSIAMQEGKRAGYQVFPPLISCFSCLSFSTFFLRHVVALSLSLSQAFRFPPILARFLVQLEATNTASGFFCSIVSLSAAATSLQKRIYLEREGTLVSKPYPWLASFLTLPRIAECQHQQAGRQADAQYRVYPTRLLKRDLSGSQSSMEMTATRKDLRLG